MNRKALMVALASGQLLWSKEKADNGSSRDTMSEKKSAIVVLRPDVPFLKAMPTQEAFLYGFKVVEAAGKMVRVPGTAEDLRSSEAKRLGIRSEDVDIRSWGYDDCAYNVYFSKCLGYCHDYINRICCIFHDGNYVYCRCVASCD